MESKRRKEDEMKVGGGVAKFVVVREDKDMAAVVATCAVVLSSSRTPPCIRNSPHNYVILRDETPNLPARQSHMDSEYDKFKGK
jgi:hypothetical protein